MVKYYEKTKSQYARDIDHLVTFNNNGLWIKESFGNSERVITAVRPEAQDLINVTIFHFDEDFNLYEKILQKVNISTNNWKLNDVILFETVDGVFKRKN